MLWYYLSAVFVVKNADIGDCAVFAVYNINILCVLLARI